MPSERRQSVINAINEYVDDLEEVRARRIMADADAMIRTLGEIRALPTTSERS